MSVKPHVVILNRFYWPDLAATAQQLTDLAEDLAASGLRVSVIASRAYYDGQAAPLPRSEKHSGVQVMRVATTRFGRGKLPGRILDYVSYLASATLALLRGERAGVIIACSDPPFLLAAAWVAARLRGAKLIYNVRDLYPHLAVEFGFLKRNGMLHRAAERVSAGLHRRCDRVVALGPAMAETIVRSGASPERTTFIPDGVDTASIRPVGRGENPLRSLLQDPQAFVVLYSGNAGRAHSFDALLEAARRLQAEAEIRFVFVGGGARRASLEAFARANRLTNLEFFDYFPREQLSLALSLGDVSVVSERTEVEGLLVPCKTYGILASGRPVIFVGNRTSDAARVVEEAGCGIVVAPESTDSLVDAILTLKRDSELRAALGTRARQAAEQLYDRKLIAASWEQIIYQTIGDREAAPATSRPPSVSAAARLQPSSAKTT